VVVLLVTPVTAGPVLQVIAAIPVQARLAILVTVVLVRRAILDIPVSRVIRDIPALVYRATVVIVVLV